MEAGRPRPHAVARGRSAFTVVLLLGAIAVWGGPVVRVGLFGVLVVLGLRLLVLVARSRRSPGERVTVARPELLGVGKAALALGTVMWIFPQQGEAQGFHWLAVAFFAAVAFDVVLGALGAATLHVELSSPADGVVGVRMPVELAVRGSVRCPVWLRMASLRRSPWVVVDPPCRGEYAVAPDARGVFPGAALTASTRGPLGLAGYTSQWYVHFAMPITVGPARLEAAIPPLPSSAARAAHHLEDPTAPPRGLRAYAPGDPPRRVHWPATAHTGQLLVRELERTAARELIALVDLGEPAPNRAADIEAVAGRAAFVLDAVLRRGIAVLLRTVEEGPQVEAGRRSVVVVGGWVATPLEVSRRLAVAVPTVRGRSELLSLAGLNMNVGSDRPSGQPLRNVAALLIDGDGVRTIQLGGV